MSPLGDYSTSILSLRKPKTADDSIRGAVGLCHVWQKTYCLLLGDKESGVQQNRVVACVVSALFRTASKAGRLDFRLLSSEPPHTPVPNIFSPLQGKLSCSRWRFLASASALFLVSRTAKSHVPRLARISWTIAPARVSGNGTSGFGLAVALLSTLFAALASQLNRAQAPLALHDSLPDGPA